MDIKETKMNATRQKKTSGVNDIKLLSMEKGLSNYISPAESIVLRGVRIKIKDLNDRCDPGELKAHQNCTFTNFEVGV